MAESPQQPQAPGGQPPPYGGGYPGYPAPTYYPQPVVRDLFTARNVLLFVALMAAVLWVGALVRVAAGDATTRDASSVLIASGIFGGFLFSLAGGLIGKGMTDYQKIGLLLVAAAFALGGIMGISAY